ncbi:NADP-dependent oxidoreductase [Nocardioides marmoriginsengisoli]|uniref:NADP-dependent oxidoreductase n=1 Tax=Nocardioides marmoriginsengisoli TaxID=661483 RepID=A0A3N0CNJ1_9ACTN|nr:NADP-dependent oxidoreductase [Nocardioides marmoriginsengisoli]RNL65037.1 NADP-dependent oxidoreductase [Nocardioides marmoriginsengisoli]
MATIVQAIAFGGPENLTTAEVEPAAPGPGEVRVEVRAAGVNPIDLKVYGGAMGADPANLPMRLGFEAAGVITEIGPGVDQNVGDEVIAFRISGAYASEVVVPATAVVPKPASLGWAEAGGLMLTGATAVHLLTATAVGDGDTVLVHGGSGGVGLMAIQLAALRGARVIATASPRRHAALESLGAEPVTYGDGLLERLQAMAPEGIDVALDLIGTDEALETSLALVADRDRIATIANFGSAPTAGVKVLGGGPGADPGTEVRANARPELARLAGEGTLLVQVGATYPLTEVAEAHRLLAAGRADGKVVLLP